MGIEVNYYTQIIYITSPTDTVTTQQLVDSIRAAEDTTEGIAFGGPVGTVVDGICDAEGKGDLGGGYLAAITLTLHSDWYIEFWDGVSLGQVAGGNVIGGDSDRPIRAAVGSTDTAYQLGAQFGTIADGSGATAQEVWEYDTSSTTTGVGAIINKAYKKIKAIFNETV